jgi:hypothetical protein
MGLPNLFGKTRGAAVELLPVQMVVYGVGAVQFIA